MTINVEKLENKMKGLREVSEETRVWLEEMKAVEDRGVDIMEVIFTGSFTNEDLEIYLKYRHNDDRVGHKNLKLIHPLKEYRQGNAKTEPICFNKQMYETVSRWKAMLVAFNKKVYSISLNGHTTLRDYLTSLK